MELFISQKPEWKMRNKLEMGENSGVMLVGFRLNYYNR